MRISGLNSFYGLPKNHKQILNLQESKITSIQKENFSTLPSDAWKAHRLTNINKINFLGNDSEKTNPIYIFLGPPLAGKGTTAN